jgi:Ca2+-binding EF-hand superfamily protein
MTSLITGLFRSATGGGGDASGESGGSSEKDIVAKQVRKLQSKTLFDESELTLLVRNFHDMSRANEHTGYSEMNFRQLVQAYGLDPIDFPEPTESSAATDRTRFLHSFFKLLAHGGSASSSSSSALSSLTSVASSSSSSSSSSRLLIDLDNFVAAMSKLLKGDAGQRAKLLARVYNVNGGKDIDRNEFRLTTQSMRELGKHIAIQGLIGQYRIHRKTFGQRAATEASARVTIERGAIVADERSSSSSSSHAKAEIPQPPIGRQCSAPFNTFVRLSHGSHIVQTNTRELFDGVWRTSDAKQITDALFDHAFDGADSVRVSQFAEWATRHPSTSDILLFYANHIKDDSGRTRLYFLPE